MLRPAEVFSASAISALSATIRTSYLAGRLGLPIFPILPLGIGGGLITALWLRPHAERDRRGLVGFLGVIVGI